MTPSLLQYLAIIAIVSSAKMNNPPRNDVTWKCRSFNGSDFFSFRYRRTEHHNHRSQRRTLPLEMMKTLIMCGHDDPEEALIEAVLVVWSRTGYLRRNQRCQAPHGEDGPTPHGREEPPPHGEDWPLPHGREEPPPHGEDWPLPQGREEPPPHGEDWPLSHGREEPSPHWEDEPKPHGDDRPPRYWEAEAPPQREAPEDHARKLARDFVVSHMQQIHINASSMFDKPHFARFSKLLLQVGLTSDPCCGVKKRPCQSHVGFHHQPDMRNTTSVFESLLHFYDRNPPMLNMNSALKYLNLAHVDRLLCVDQTDFNITTNKGEATRDALAHMVQYILLEFRTLMRTLNLTDRNPEPQIKTTEITPTTKPTVKNSLSRRSENRPNNPHSSQSFDHHSSNGGPNDPSPYIETSQLYQLNSGEATEGPLINKCFSSKGILRLFNKEHSHSIDLNTFVDLCPVLLHQVLTETCRSPGHGAPTENPASVNATSIPQESARTDSQQYLYGSLSILVISSCSLLGVVFIKFIKSEMKHYIMGSLLALAVGCLVADAVLHLLPEINAIHHDDTEKPEGELLPKNLQKLCALLASIYGFFMLELYLSRHNSHSHSHGPAKPEELTVIVKNNKLKETNSTSGGVISLQQWRKSENVMQSNMESPGSSADVMADVMEISRDEATEARANTGNNYAVVKCDSNESERGKEKSTVDKSKRAIAWMIIIGDGIHNFADGLAVGAAFSLSFTKGLSTSITVFCHELPHELGDFAVLVSTGMSVKRALVLNFLSSLTAFAGLYMGLGLGDQPEAGMWIFSVGAGMFLYVALTDLIPECKEYFRQTPDWKMVIGQNLGILLGYTGMLLLAMFEDRVSL